MNFSLLNLRQRWQNTNYVVKWFSSSFCEMTFITNGTTRKIDFHLWELDEPTSNVVACMRRRKKEKWKKYVPKIENVKYSQKRQQAFQFYCLQNTHNLKTGQTCIPTKIAHQSFAIGNPPEFCHQKIHQKSIGNSSESASQTQNTKNESLNTKLHGKTEYMSFYC